MRHVLQEMKKHLGAMPEISKKVGLQSDPLQISGTRALLDSLDHTVEFHLTTGTMQMLQEYLGHYDETVHEVQKRLDITDEGTMLEAFYTKQNTMYHRGVCIVFPKPLSFCKKMVYAMHCMSPTFYLPTGKDGYQLMILGEQATPEHIIRLNPPQAWGFEPMFPHQCDACEHEGNALIRPCQACGMELVTWSKIFAMSSLIITQALADIRYVTEESYTTIRRKKREHSNKTRAEVVRHIIKTIDVSEVLVLLPSSKEEEPQRKAESGDSWVLRAQQENDLIYREVTTRAFQRTYRSPRFVNVQGQTVQFPLGMTQRKPLRASLDGKRIVKARASKYDVAPVPATQEREEEG